MIFLAHQTENLQRLGVGTAVRQTGFPRYHGGPIEGPLKPLEHLRTMVSRHSSGLRERGGGKVGASIGLKNNVQGFNDHIYFSDAFLYFNYIS